MQQWKGKFLRSCLWAEVFASGMYCLAWRDGRMAAHWAADTASFLIGWWIMEGVMFLVTRAKR